MSDKKIQFSDLVATGVITATKQENMTATTYAKYRIMRELNQTLNSYRDFANTAYDEIVTMKEEQGDAFTEDQYDYKRRKEDYLEYKATLDITEKLITWLYEA